MVSQVIAIAPAKQAVAQKDDWEEQYRLREALFSAQATEVQRMLELQSRLIAKALENHLAPLHLMLPDRVRCEVGNNGQPRVVPADLRDQKIGGLMDSLEISDLKKRLAELEAASDQAVVISAWLVRHAIASHLVHGMLPAGRTPEVANWDFAKISAYARRFFYPQWVAFDDQDNLLVNSIQDAEALIACMQRYLSLLASAASIAPYIVADREYQRKRNGMLQQLVDQGAALARHRTGEMINTVRKRAASGSLNRGLSLSLPYFDDGALEIRHWEFPVIPRGRVQFVPAFVVVAARMEQIKVEHEPGMPPSIRRNILRGLEALEMAFDLDGGSSRR